MIFANLFFLYLFLPLNIILYFISKNKTYRNVILVAFSMFFYAWGEPLWICILLLSVGIDFLHGILVEKYRGTWKSKAALISSIILNLSLLCIFKYSGFIVANINGVLGTGIPVPKIALPIGISFYTFQLISYMVDVYRGEVKAQRSFTKFLMYVSMYHQLVAGPIVRYSHIADEIENRVITKKEVSAGITRFIVGLSKKVMIANSAGALASQYLDGDLTKLSAGGAWFGIIMFTLQIYFDFSGYSDMAIGLGMLFGFHYRENFCYPYISHSATEFWRRWHISLGSFFRDYVYIPMGGNRKHQYLNLFVVWLLTGLWHGASWNFILWGLYFGLLIVLEKLFLGKLLDKIPKIFSWLYLMAAVVFGWGLFYFVDMSRFGLFLKAMFGGNNISSANTALSITISSNILWIITAVICTLPIVPWFKKKLSDCLYDDSKAYVAIDTIQIVVNLGLLFICTMLLVGQSYNPFLYYRF